jgi:hypothetical protein
MDTTKSSGSTTSPGSADPEIYQKLEETVRTIRALADQLSSSTSFESVRIAKQLEDQASALRRLRNSIVHGVTVSGATPSASNQSTS